MKTFLTTYQDISGKEIKRGFEINFDKEDGMITIQDDTYQYVCFHLGEFLEALRDNDILHDQGLTLD